MDSIQTAARQGMQPPQGGNLAGGPPGAGGFGGRGGGLMFLGPYGSIVMVALLAITYLIMAIAMYQFLKKSGLTPWVAILMLVPVVNLGVALWAAFTSWPILREVERLKMLVATAQMVSAPVEFATPEGEASSAGRPSHDA